MNTAKPILVIRMPDTLMQSHRVQITNQLIELKDRLDDYHLIPVFESGLSRTEFKCYNPPKSKLTIEKLSKIIDKLNLMF
jgi:hypothetical protein